MDMTYTFRFDDVSLNTDTAKLCDMIAYLRQRLPHRVRIMLVVSPSVFQMDHFEKVLDRERTFPPALHVESDFREFYKTERIGIPHVTEHYKKDSDVCLAAHGLVHVDHRLMARSAQELSIVMSCSLLGCRIFVPPFHKWNSKTEKICTEHEIELFKGDSSWRHLGFHPFDPENENYYLHTHDFHLKDFCARFSQRVD